MVAVVMPSAVRLTVDWVRSVSAITTIATGGIHHRLTDDFATPTIRVTRIGGAQAVEARLDRAVVQFEAFAAHERDDIAETLANTVRAHLEDVRGWVHPTLPAVLHSTTEVLGPQQIPDDTHALVLPRVLWRTAVHVRPNP